MNTPVLRRSTSDKWIGGVCSGIAKRLGVESWIIRMGLVIGFFFGPWSGGLLLMYVLLWIFMPLDRRIEKFLEYPNIYDLK